VHVLLIKVAENGPWPTSLAEEELVTDVPSPNAPWVFADIEFDAKMTAGPYWAAAPSTSVTVSSPPAGGSVAEGLHAAVVVSSQPVVEAGPRTSEGPPKRLTLVK
jgi:hypothetical protein